MKSKEEMIEAMARAMFLNEQNTTKGWAIIGGWESCPVWFKRQLIRHAEAALKALCGALPDEDNEWHAVDILHELKQWVK